MTKYADTVYLLDLTRRRMEERVAGAIMDTALLLRRLNTAIEELPEHTEALSEQRVKLYELHDHLTDFRDYLDEPRAWAPAKEEGDEWESGHICGDRSEP